MIKIWIVFFVLFSFSLRVKADFKIEEVSSYILIEASTNKIICESEAHHRQAPASMTKIMTITLILEEIKKGNIKYDEMINTSANASSQTGSRIFLSTNEKMSVRDMLKGIAIASANDASVALAERIAGSEEAFVAKMNEYAKKLNLVNTNFVNTTGLTANNHYSSSYDMAIMASNLINKFPEILETTKIYQDYLRQDSDPFWLVNTNKLVYSKEVDGLKTGWTEEAGYCLTATKKVGSTRLIGVIMGAKKADERNKKMVQLLNYGFSSFKVENLETKGKIITSIYDINCKPCSYNIVLKEDVNVLLPVNYDKSKLSFDYSISKFGGNYNVYYDGILISQSALVCSCEVRNSNIIDRFVYSLKMAFKV